MSLIDNLMGVTGMKLNDQIIANSTALGIKGSANAYLAACISCVTPEVGRFCADYLNQNLVANEVMTGIILKKNWAQPYADPQEQMSQAYKQSDWVLNQNENQM